MRVLIVDDDPVSLHFLANAASGLGLSVIAAANAAEALTALEWAAFDLLLLDRRMPGVSGAELLAELRARRVTAPALATSAELNAAIVAELREAGFVDAIAKPIAIAQLERALRPHLPAAAHRRSGDGLLDDDAALDSVGSDAEALHALRRLFVEELANVERDWRADAEPIERERLHRLRASCGFCGATALAEAAHRLEQALRQDSADCVKRADEFLALCRATRAALSSTLLSGR